MMLTEKMVVTASKAYSSIAFGLHPEALRAALIAALSTDAEPVIYVSRKSLEELLEAKGSHVALQTLIHRKPLRSGNGVPLYAEPVKTAPAVAVNEHAKVRERMIGDVKGLIEFLSESPDNIYHLDTSKVSELRSALSKNAEPVNSQKVAELDGVPDALAYGKGIWRTCTGCHESNEGYPTGPFSDTLKCHLGGGCFECGGIGAVWDTTDYEDMGNFIALSAQVQDLAVPEGWQLVPIQISPDMQEIMIAGEGKPTASTWAKLLRAASPASKHGDAD